MSDEVRRMAELLKSGYTMLSETCPKCGSPLYRRGKETFCVKCNRPVVIVSSDAEEARVIGEQALDNLEQTLMTKVQEINIALKTETDPSRLSLQAEVLSKCLENIERLRRLRAS